MAFDLRSRARPCVIQAGDTLAAVAERETRAGNPITWQQIARFNWGTDEEAEVDAFLRDELGCRERDETNRYVITDPPSPPLLLPVPFQRPDLAPDRAYTLRVRRPSAARQFLGCCSLPGVTFAPERSFLRPAVAEHLKVLGLLADAHPEAKIMVFGHTDGTGSESYNKKLSERRAWSVYAFVTDDIDAWEVLYDHPDERWGLAVVQEILADLGHYAAAIDGDMGPATRDAMRRLLGLPDAAPVRNDAAFRRHLFGAYMTSKHDIRLPAERFVPDGYMGCGEFNPLEPTSEVAEANRRVTFFLFHPSRLPTLPCAYADTTPCHGQMVSTDRRHTPTFRCSFYDSLARGCAAEDVATLRIRLFDAFGAPMPEAACRVTVGRYLQEVTADADGYVEVRAAGTYARALVEWGTPADAPDDDVPEDSGFRYRQDIFLNFDETPDAPEAALRRLHNLGYPVDPALVLEEQAAVVRTFQLHYADRYGLPEAHGELDDATREALREVHDTCALVVDPWA